MKPRNGWKTTKPIPTEKTWRLRKRICGTLPAPNAPKNTGKIMWLFWEKSVNENKFENLLIWKFENARYLHFKTYTIYLDVQNMPSHSRTKPTGSTSMEPWKYFWINTWKPKNKQFTTYFILSRIYTIRLFYWVHSLIIFKMRSFQIQCKPSLRLINRNNYQCNHFPAIESILVSTLTENKFHSGDYEFKNLKTY